MSPSSTEPERGQIVRPRKGAPERSWRSWVPGIEMLRRYELAWLRHDIMAGLVLTTMLVPVGVAYAVASGVPGIYGLYATIVPLLAYALFGPSRILVLGPDSSLAADHPRRGRAAVGRRSAARNRPGQHDGHRFGSGMHPRRRGAAGFRYRAVVEADPLRLHERDRADGVDQPAAQAVRLFDRHRRAAAKPVGDRRGGAGWQG